MQYARVGNSGLVVSRLSMGTWTFGINGTLKAVYKVSKQDANAMVAAALDAGINSFDTADAYGSGASETILGEALGTRRKDVVIATKVGFRNGDGITQAGLSRRQILASCEASLLRLGTDYIDLYIVHKEDPFTPLEETLKALDELVHAGKVRYVGYSNWSAWKAATALQMQKANSLEPFTCGQMYYSIIGRDVEHEIIPFIQFAHLGMTVWSPLAGGFLSGKYTRGHFKDPAHRLSGLDAIPFDRDLGFRVVDRLRQISKLHGASVSQVSLAWLLAKPVVSSVIIGASNLQQLRDNLTATDVALRQTEIEEVDALTAPASIYPTWFSESQLDRQHIAARLAGSM